MIDSAGNQMAQSWIDLFGRCLRCGEYCQSSACCPCSVVTTYITSTIANGTEIVRLAGTTFVIAQR